MTGSAESRERRPRVAVDHVLIPARDLAESARHMEAAYGLRALPGGRHPGVGTANMIVPLGSAYLELIAVVDTDEAAQSPTSRRITRALDDSRTFALWAVRTNDLDAMRERLQTEGIKLPDPSSGTRQRPDGVILRWRTQFLAPPDQPSVLPFVIEWLVPPGMHPAEAPVRHPSGARGIRLVRLGDPNPAAAAERLGPVLGENLPCVVEKAGTSGVLAVELDTPRGAMVIE